MFEYTICKENNTTIFKLTCKKISEMFPDATVHKLLVDVDGSTIQAFTHEGKDIDVYDDYDVGAVFIKSEIELIGLNQKDVLDDDLSADELLNLKERMCGTLKSRRLTAEEIEQLKKENRI